MGCKANSLYIRFCKTYKRHKKQTIEIHLNDKENWVKP